jgi:hypothetical protein
MVSRSKGVVTKPLKELIKEAEFILSQFQRVFFRDTGEHYASSSFRNDALFDLGRPEFLANRIDFNGEIHILLNNHFIFRPEDGWFIRFQTEIVANQPLPRLVVVTPQIL